MALTKFIYSGHIDPKKTPFGLINHQTRITDDVISCAGWFNGSGEKLGAGDLSIKDLHRISVSIGKESFLVLSEGDTLWSVPSSLNSSEPGIDYVMQRCVWYVTTGCIIRIRDGKDEEAERDGIKYKRMSRQSFFASLKYVAGKLPEAKTTLNPKKKLSIDEAMAIIKQKIGTIKVSTKPSPLIGSAVTTAAPAAATMPLPASTTKPSPAQPGLFPSFLPKKKIKKKVTTPSP